MSDDHLYDLHRIGKITASMVGAILRIDGCQSRKWAWRCVTGREKERPPNWDMQRGNNHEKDAVSALEVELGLLARPGRFVCHPSIPWLGASPDGFLLEGGGEIPIEAKCPRVLHSEVPDMYISQTQVQLECCDAPYGYFVSWTEEGQWVTRVERDPVWWSANYPILEAFYKDYVATDIEPPISPRRSKKNDDGRRVAGSGRVLQDKHPVVDAVAPESSSGSDPGTPDAESSGHHAEDVRDDDDAVPRTRRTKARVRSAAEGDESARAKAFFATRVAVPKE